METFYFALIDAFGGMLVLLVLMFLMKCVTLWRYKRRLAKQQDRRWDRQMEKRLREYLHR